MSDLKRHRPKSSLTLRHKQKVEEYLKFQETHKEKSEEGLVPRPGEFLVVTKDLSDSPSKYMGLSELQQSGVLFSRPSSAQMTRNTLRTSKKFFSSTQTKFSQDNAILTRQLRKITKPQKTQNLTLSKLAMTNEKLETMASAYISSRPSSTKVGTHNWSEARRKDFKAPQKPDYIVSSRKNLFSSYSNRTLVHSESKSTRLETSGSHRFKPYVPRKRDKQEKNPGFSVTQPMDLFLFEAEEEMKHTEFTKFLPLETYDPCIDTESPHSLINSLKDQYGRAKAFSRWFFADGSYEWRECEILRYNDSLERYEIKWLNKRQKKVSRLNLRLPYEDENHFERRLELARKYRDRAESIMKYRFQIQQIQTPTTSIPLKVFKNILKALKGERFKKEFPGCGRNIPKDPKFYLWEKETTHMVDETFIWKKRGFANLEQFKESYLVRLKEFKLLNQVVTYPKLKHLIAEVEGDFKYTLHQIEYEADMPYNTEKQELFKDILPPEKFIWPFEAFKQPSNTLGVVEKLPYNFNKVFNYISTQLHQAFSETFEILYKQNILLLEFKDLNFFTKHYRKPCELEKFVQFNQVETANCLRELRNVIFDVQCEIQSLVNEENAQKFKRNQEKLKARAYEQQEVQLEKTLPEEFVTRIKRLLNLCNHTIERQATGCFENSLKELQKQLNLLEGFYEGELNEKELKQLIYHEEWNKKNYSSPRIECTLTYEKENGTLKLAISPSINQITQKFTEMIQFSVEELQKVNSMEISEIGRTRESRVLKVTSSEAVEGHLNNLKASLSNLWRGPESLLEALRKFEFLLNTSSKSLKQKFQKNYDLHRIKKKLHLVNTAKEDLTELLKNKSEVFTGLFVVKVKKMQDFMLLKADKLLKLLKELVVSHLDSSITDLEQLNTEINNTLKHQPSNLEELHEIKTFIQSHLSDKVQLIKEESARVFENISVLEEFKHEVDLELHLRAWLCFAFPKEILQIRKKCLSTIFKYEKVFAEELKHSQIEIVDEMENIKFTLFDLKKEYKIEKYEEMSVFIEELKSRLETAIETGKTINTRESIVGVEITDTKQLEKFKREFTPFYNIWSYIRNFKYNFPMWTKGYLSDLDSQAVADEIDFYISEINRLQKTSFKDSSSGLKLTNDLMNLIEKFSPYVPLIKSLKNKGLQERHWQAIQKETQLEIDQSLNVSLNELVEQGITLHETFVINVSEKASKELALENAKKKMENQWEDFSFTVVAYKSSETYVVTNTEPIWELIDEHLMKTVSMFNSPYIEFMRREVTAWKNGLLKLQDTLEEWENFQKSWQYLLPVFSSQDIAEELPALASKFSYIDEQWKALMKQVEQNPGVIDCCFGIPGLKDQLAFYNETLNLVRKSLNDYLNVKRKAFPRFYFLSNEELLTILSSSREISSVQSYIGKCFEGIGKMILDKEYQILGMQSPDSEEVYFLEKVPIFKDPKTLKYVEVWMSEVQEKMVACLKELMKGSVEDKSSILEWVRKWPSQIVHAVNMVNWTHQTEKAIHTGLIALKSYLETEKLRLKTIVELAREPLSELESLTVSTLVVLNVHTKDLLEDLSQKRVKDIQDFEWQSQMRYYYQEPSVVVEMIETSINYGFEYLGNQSRLVITPLTDRCYRTLMSALKLSLGGAPEGPAGTGKTETVKDLSKSVAKKCVVFNCSDSLDHIYMAKFLTGLCYCGAWACFDEFNRIEQEVLSVVAEQIFTIQSAVFRNSKRFWFEGEDVLLDSSCGVFITMNPGYVGRSELPDNLKALFRPVAMMIPNYSMIGEIYLYSYGFTQARLLAEKLVTSLRLASEQLSTQSHYDYGMRAVTTIIKVAGMLKKECPDLEEDLCVFEAIKKSNMPKFLEEDILLFKGILSDLFPNIKETENTKLRVKANNLTLSRDYEEKVLQLYNIMKVKHGVIVLGNSVEGKTSLIKTLASTLCELEEEVTTAWINPKAVHIDHLYGVSDSLSYDWIDGILSHQIRSYAESTTLNKKWVVFDGPVDSNWIENMNTVLDDNKKLCLASGEIIKLTSEMSVVFETESLDNASPATVSRCGMVYLESVVTWKAIFSSWLENLPLAYQFEKFRVLIESLFGHFVDPCLEFVLQSETSVRVSKNWLVQSLIKLLEAMLLKSSFSKAKHNSDFKKAQKQNSKAQEFVLEEKAVGKLEQEEVFKMFLFALTWSLGGPLKEGARNSFLVLLEELYNSSSGDFEKVYQNPFKMFYNYQAKSWQPWKTYTQKNTLESYSIDSLFVPTEDTASCVFLMEKLLTKDCHVLLTGPTGTGKSLVCKRFVSETLESSKFLHYTSTFSARTSAEQLQGAISSKLSKRGKTTFGPELGKKLVMLVDDMNLPAKDNYGAQPPLELVRQVIEHKQWYDLSDCSAKSIEDLMFLGVMSSTSSVSQRLMRHYFLVNINEFSNSVLETIFTEFMEIGLSEHFHSIKTSIGSLVSASIEIYKNLVTVLPPTPAKSHYLFNIRDIRNALRGVISVSEFQEKETLYRAWIHESLRVFSDRLVNEQDKLQFKNLLKQSFEKWTQVSVEETCSKEPLFCNLLGNYQETEVEYARKAVENSIEEYKSTNHEKLNLVLFDLAVHQISRIARVLSSPNGHLMLVGLAGSGRSTLTKLAAFMLKCSVFQIQVRKNYDLEDWKEDLKAMLYKAGVENQSCVFLLRSNEVHKEAFFEDINSILNSGEVPNLHKKDEKELILDTISQGEQSSEERWDFFVGNCKKNLHIVLLMTPVGEELRLKLRQFPSLLSCCNINWFSEWPSEALISVAEKSLLESGLPQSSSELESICEVCKYFHQTAKALSTEYYTQNKKVNYFTPTHYLQLLHNIKSLYGEKFQTTIKNKQKYLNGIQKLDETQVKIHNLQETLTEFKPQLEQKTKDVGELMEKLKKDNEIASETRKVVANEQQESAVQAEIAEKMKKESEEALEKALPQLEEAKKALKTLKRDDINLVKNMGKPPEAVRIVIEAIVIMHNQKPLKVQNPKDKSSQYSYFEAGKKMLANPKFLKNIQKFKKESLTQETIDKVTPYLENPNFSPEKVKRASNAAEGLCKWVKAVVNFYYINQDIIPKEQTLAAAKETMAEKYRILEEKQKELQEVEDRIMDLQNQYEEKETEKQNLISKIEDCELKMERAIKLLNKMGGEKTRWTNRTKELETGIKNLAGDILLSAGVISYLGNFTGTFREKLIHEKWVPFIQSRKDLVCSQEFSFKDFEGNQVEVLNWTLKGLPNDKVSIENAIILQKSSLWPLMVDPQKQANKWLKKLAFKDDLNLVVTNPLSEDFPAVLENALFVGAHLLIEEMPQEIDLTLDPLLLKQYYTQEGVTMVYLGDSPKQLDPKFKLYITTSLPSPHFTPETSTKVTLLDFSITQEGLSEQLLALVCQKELPKETQEKTNSMVQSATYMASMQKFEDQILKMLQDSDDSILDNEELINSLTESKTMSETAQKKLESSKKTQQKIQEFQERYLSVANLSAVLYFCVDDMKNINHMYNFSMEWFLSLFVRSLKKAQKSTDLPTRLANLIESFRTELFNNITMSLFEKDKLLFSFLMLVRILKHQGQVPEDGWEFLLTGIVGAESSEENPGSIEDKLWQQLCQLSKLEAFKGLNEHFKQNLEVWKEFISSQRTFESFPDPYNELTLFEKLLLLKATKPELIIPAIKQFIELCLGSYYLQAPISTLSGAFEESTNSTPLVLVLSPGNDPQSSLKRFAFQKQTSISSLSLGKGQGDKATKLILENARTGGWVLLQNCHLASSWLPKLKAITEKLKNEAERKKLHSNFRLWLTTLSDPEFPTSILQSGVKFINEPPESLKQNLLSIYKGIANNKEELNFYNSSAKPEEWRKFLFGLSFFHCLVRQRRTFGALGWNVFYEFNDSDFRLSMKQLKMMLDKYSQVPYKALIYLTGECNYGGRITDDWDRRTLMNLLSDYYTDDILYSHYRLCSIDEYKCPQNSDNISDYIEFIQNLPNEVSPEVLGLHPNASVTFARKETSEMVSKLLDLQPKFSDSTENQKQKAKEILDEIQNCVKQKFDILQVKEKYQYNSSLNVVLIHELTRYNTLTRRIRKSLKELNLALEGKMLITSELENLEKSLMNNQVPKHWEAYSYSSCKPLLSWVRDLKDRLCFFQNWVEKGQPEVFWISGFFFTQAFLTGVLQTHARKHSVPIDNIKFSFEFIERVQSAPEEGCLIQGLFLEGASWDFQNKVLAEPLPKVLFCEMPVIWLKPCLKGISETVAAYECPVYKTSKRAGVLSTTGHSTNFIMSILLPTNHDQKHWVKRGAALITQLDD